MVDRKIPGSYRPAESAGFFLSSEALLPKPTQILYAGKSHRRHHFLSTVFDVPITTFNVDPEPKTSDLEVIVNHKLGIVLNSMEAIMAEGGLIIAADTQTVVTTVDGIGVARRTNKTKPSSEEEVQELFRDMSEFPLDPHYSVRAASATHDVGIADRSCLHIDQTDITLDPSSVAYLATNEGFSDYKNAFARFYSSDVYERNGLPQIGLHDISSGLSLPVLTMIGVVKAIDGVAISKQDEFTDAFQRALHIVAIGISPELFRRYPLSEFGWIREVTKEVLS